MDAIPLETLETGQAGRVVEVDAPDDWRHRLAELGLREGVVVRLVKGGTPCLIGIGTQRLSLRIESSVMILVEALSHSASSEVA